MTTPNTLTDAQFEIAARHYCELMGEDAEQLIAHSPPLNPNGTVNLVAIHSPRWMLVAESLRTQWAANEALRFAQEGVAP